MSTDNQAIYCVKQPHYQVKAKCFDVFVLNGGAIGGKPLGDDEQNFARFVVQFVAGKEDAATKGGTKN
jgi:hypothetical protein